MEIISFIMNEPTGGDKFTLEPLSRLALPRIIASQGYYGPFCPCPCRSFHWMRSRQYHAGMKGSLIYRTVITVYLWILGISWHSGPCPPPLLPFPRHLLPIFWGLSQSPSHQEVDVLTSCRKSEYLIICSHGWNNSCGNCVRNGNSSTKLLLRVGYCKKLISITMLFSGSEN